MLGGGSYDEPMSQTPLYTLMWVFFFFHVHPICWSCSGSLGVSLICGCRFGMPMGGVEFKIPLCDIWYRERWKNTLSEITMILLY